LLESIERDLPKLRIVLIGGEACPPALVKRWSRPGRTLLHSYGPTEATVTATLGVLAPDRPVTIGRPLPTYSIVILDPVRDEALARGETGEIGIGGIGVAEGYLNRPELTAARFIEDFLALPNNPSGRIYRTGDLGRINEDREIEFLGRTARCAATASS
jgi:non-ribosomal peptide synthetase component F